MGVLSIVLAASALAGSAAAAPPEPSSSDASLSFVAPHQLLVGGAYGLDAIDSLPRVYGQRLSADVVAGQRTVWYSCPDAPITDQGSRLTFDFEAGHRYELVCRQGQDAEIRLADGC